LLGDGVYVIALSVLFSCHSEWQHACTTDPLPEECEPGGAYDLDADGHPHWIAGGDDCDDEIDTVYLDAPEACDRLDNDCDGVEDDGELDCDEDGVTAEDGDCNDFDAAQAPDYVLGEICDGRDNDCDGAIDEDLSDCVPS
jgi:hypothetical protein